jgi:ATP/ADP translocase/CRP-like cAMP-binding protein
MARLRVMETLDRRLDLEVGDRITLILMAGQILGLLGAYTTIKVLRDTLFISRYGANALPWGYVAVALAAVALIGLEARVSRRLNRGTVSDLNQYVAIGMCALAAALQPFEPAWLPALFYVWSGSQALLLLSHFWITALDAWDSQRARVIFPLLTGFGLLGGIAGGAFSGWGVESLGITRLLWITCALLVAVRLLTIWLSAKLPLRPLNTQVAAGTSRWRTFTGSAYLRTLAVVLGLAVVVSTLVDFQFKSFAQQAFPQPRALAAFLGRFYAGLHALALLVQFGLAGWILRRIGLGASSGLQPASMVLFGAGLIVAPIWPVAQAMRWVQGIVFQTLGKASSEIYFMAIRPPERRQIKPLIDVVVERGSDALAGLLLLAVFAVLGVDVRIIAGLTGITALVWIAMLWRLHRLYVRAFRESLAAPWAEPETAIQSLRVPGAVEGLLEAIRSDDERQATIALRFAARARRAKLAPAVREALARPALRVRTEAVRAATALGLAGEDDRVRTFLAEPSEALQRAAVEYLLTHGRDAPAFAGEVLDGDDETLRDLALDLMVEKPALAHGAITLDWVDRRIAAGSRHDLRDACRGLAHLPGPEAAKRLAELLPHRDREVRRAALRALARQPEPAFLEVAIAHLADRGLRFEARDAIVAYRDAAVPHLERIAAQGVDDDVRALATAALARIGSLRARRVLVDLARSADPVSRYHGLRNLNRVRAWSGRRLVSRRDARRMFLREIREYRTNREPELALPAGASPALDLLAASYAEAADRALERACRALGCYHWPVPLQGVYEGLRAGSSREAGARALEYLDSILPRRMFQPVRALLERRPELVPDPAAGDEPMDPVPTLEKALSSSDPWIRAAAARAARERGLDVPAPQDEEETRMISAVEKVMLLRGVDLFRKTGPRQLLVLANRVREVPMWKGQTIYQESDPADAVYIVVDGSVRLSAEDKALAEVGSGEAFGTWALVDDAARAQRADCLEDGRLLALDREDFYDFASGDAQLLKELVRVLAERLKELVAERPDEARVGGEGAAAAEGEGAPAKEGSGPKAATADPARTPDAGA